MRAANNRVRPAAPLASIRSVADSGRPDWPGLSWPRLVAVSRALRIALTAVPAPPWRAERKTRARLPRLPSADWPAARVTVRRART